MKPSILLSVLVLASVQWPAWAQQPATAPARNAQSQERPLAARVLSRSPRTDETITRMTGREVIVRANADSPRQLDGDLIEPGREIRARCVHGRLLVRVRR